MFFHNPNQEYRFQSNKLNKVLFVVGFIMIVMLTLFGKAKASDNGTIPPDQSKVFLPLIACSNCVSPDIAPDDEITVTYNIVYVNTTVTKTVKAALNYIAMTNTKTMTNVTPVTIEFGDMRGVIKAQAYIYHYHTATKNQPCAQIKVAVNVAGNKARNVIGRACYAKEIEHDAYPHADGSYNYDTALNDLYNAVNDQVDLIN